MRPSRLTAFLASLMMLIAILPGAWAQAPVVLGHAGRPGLNGKAPGPDTRTRAQLALRPSAAALAGPATAIGQALNLGGATQVMNKTTLMAMSFENVPGTGSTLNSATLWKPGYTNRYSQNPDGGGICCWFTGINPDQETGVFATLQGMQQFGGSVYSSPGPQGPLTITPRRPTADEQAAWNQRGNDLNKRVFMSGAGVTYQAGIAPPYMFEFEGTIPTQPGLCPAFWLLNTKNNWPAGENDILEWVNGDPNNANRVTTSIHTVDNTWVQKTMALHGGGLTYVSDGGGGGYGSGNEQQSTITQDIKHTFDPSAGPHRYGVVVYPDYMYVTIDRVIVMIWPTPQDMVSDSYYALFDYAIGHNAWFGNWAGGNTPPPPMKISDFQVYKMPAVYGSGIAPPPPPPPPPPTTTTFTVDSQLPAVASGQVPVNGSSGTQWVNVAAFDMNWVKLSADVTPANGKWSLKIDTTKLPDGSDAIQVVAFSVPAGQTGGVAPSILPLTLAVNNSSPPPPVATITGVTYTGTSPVPANTGPGVTLGTIAVQETNGTFAGTLSLPSTETRFKIVGSTLQPAIALPPGNYLTTITAVQAGVAGSPKSVAVNLVVSPAVPAGLTPEQKALVTTAGADVAAAVAATAKAAASFNAAKAGLGVP